MLLLALAVTAACDRPLSQDEARFANAFFADRLDTQKVRVHVGVGILPLPLPKSVPENTETTAPPKGICDRVQQPGRSYSYPAAFVLWNDVFLSQRWYHANSFQGWPDSVPLPHSLLMAHELVHVWQWQNRKKTLYTPTKSVSEGSPTDDPYYWQIEGDAPYLSYGYEKQAAMVEDYICYRLFDPKSPKLKELRPVLAPFFDLEGLDDELRRARKS